TPDSPRSLPAEKFTKIIEEQFGVEAQAIPDMKDALYAALCRIGEDEAICICGSLYQLGSVQEYFELR
ncbi:MAG: bifunctional folylpolyglutamate synthase/dihydrofolate synthase, partial [Clostridiales bacterium]|nr:bifunctional folylpolyglutamate synthase/dihydrofolate synthase [Clostridiales bacterium]